MKVLNSQLSRLAGSAGRIQKATSSSANSLRHSTLLFVVVELIFWGTIRLRASSRRILALGFFFAWLDLVAKAPPNAEPQLGARGEGGKVERR